MNEERKFTPHSNESIQRLTIYSNGQVRTCAYIHQSCTPTHAPKRTQE